MSHSTNSKQQDILNTQSNVEETHKERSILYEREELTDTPFHIVTDETGSYLIIGNYRLTLPMKTKVEVKLYLETHKWNIVLQMIAIAVDRIRPLEDYLKTEQIMKHEEPPLQNDETPGTDHTTDE